MFDLGKTTLKFSEKLCILSTCRTLNQNCKITWINVDVYDKISTTMQCKIVTCNGRYM